MVQPLTENPHATSDTSRSVVGRTLHRVFQEHPQTVDETYFEHLRFAGWFASRLFAAGFAALVHAVVPCLFEKTAGLMIKEMNERLSNRH